MSSAVEGPVPIDGLILFALYLFTILKHENLPLLLGHTKTDRGLDLAHRA